MGLNANFSISLYWQRTKLGNKVDFSEPKPNSALALSAFVALLRVYCFDGGLRFLFLSVHRNPT